jgi:cytochrome oxidase Cu insertion factor (SCO1/SenC/PrrC family)
VIALALRSSLAPGPGGSVTHSLAGELPTRALTGDAVWAAGERPAPPLALRDQSNQLVSLAGQRGHAVLLTFMDSHCRLICTLQGPSIAQVLRRTHAHGHVTLLVVSVNPWEDTAASSAAAGRRYGFPGDWHWLRGTPAEMSSIWRSYGIAVQWSSDDVSHSTAIYLIDGRGYERAGFNFPFPQAQVERDLRELARAPS